jgi:hypothetical protein
MNTNAIARKLIRLGQREHALLQKLNAVAAERCALLRQVAADPDAGLDGPVTSLSVAPKEPPPGGGE